MRRTAAIILTVVLCGAPLGAWGGEGHRLILDRAIALLPDPIKPVFERQRAMLIERAVDPDLWRVVGFDEEEPRHFLDLDFYGKPPFDALPREYGAAVEKFGHETIITNGVLPWHATEMYGRLVRAFEQQKARGGGVDTIMLLAAVVGHYAADANQPMHATLNYDGQLTGQTGLHSRFESDALRRFVTKLTISPKPPVPITNARDAMFASLEASATQVEAVLRADLAAVGTRTEYDDGYFDLFFAAVKPILERQLDASITMTAAMIVGAWDKAGRPDLTVQPRNTVRKVRK
jgi:hypothetical protein